MARGEHEEGVTLLVWVPPWEKRVQAEGAAEQPLPCLACVEGDAWPLVLKEASPRPPLDGCPPGFILH